MYRELATRVDVTAMGKAQKVQRFGTTRVTSVSIGDRKTTEFEQTCFLRMRFQPELAATFVECRKARLGFGLGLKADHEVVRIADDDHITTAMVFTPPLNPEVQNVV